MDSIRALCEFGKQILTILKIALITELFGLHLKAVGPGCVVRKIGAEIWIL